MKSNNQHKDLLSKFPLSLNKKLKNVVWSSPTVSFRNLGLDSTDVNSIMEIIKVLNDSQPINSISFSYNTDTRDMGTKIIFNNLPDSIRDIGMVDCGIKDEGGKTIITKIQQLKSLNMLCIEGNNFSDFIKKELNAFSKKHPQTVVVV